MRPSCPFLPTPEQPMSWRDLNQHRQTGGAELYVAALNYAQQLWVTGHTARAVLAIDRALYADLNGDEGIVESLPVPYEALAWILKNDPQDSFLGNPRVSYQHLAGRVRGARVDIRRWRSWACWYLVRLHRPELPRDENHRIKEPTEAEIATNLERFGYDGEVATWQKAFNV